MIKSEQDYFIHNFFSLAFNKQREDGISGEKLLIIAKHVKILVFFSLVVERINISPILFFSWITSEFYDEVCLL